MNSIFGDDMPLIAVFAILFCIVFTRAFATYWLGRGVVNGLSRNDWVAKRLASPSYKKACELVNNYGAPVVSLCFITVGLQTAVLISSGATKMSLRRFVPALIVGSLLWATIYSTVGFVGFALWRYCYQIWPVGTIVVSVAIVGAVVGYAVWRSRHREHHTHDDAP